MQYSRTGSTFDPELDHSKYTWKEFEKHSQYKVILTGEKIPTCITTKKGEKGKPRINFTSYTALQEITARIPLVDNYGWARIINAAHDADGANRQSKADVDFNPDINTDWQEEVFSKSAKIRDVNMSVSGGGENSTVFFWH